MKSLNIQVQLMALPILLFCGYPVTGCGISSDGSEADAAAAAAATQAEADAAAAAAAEAAAAAAASTDTTNSGPAAVQLEAAGHFVILAKAGIDTIPASQIIGNIGVSPIDRTALTRFSETIDSSNEFARSTQVIGKLYAADYAAPTPINLSVAIGDMEAAHADAAGRMTPDFTELGAGDISGLVLEPGLYKWSTGVVISADVTLHGGPFDVWIFQIDGGLTQASATRVKLTGGALPKNVFWQVLGAVALGTTAHLEGVVLCKKEITLATGASVKGRLFAQTAVTLDQCAITQPAP